MADETTPKKRGRPKKEATDASTEKLERNYAKNRIPDPATGKLPVSGPNTWPRKPPQTITDEKPEDVQAVLGQVLQWYKQPKCKTDEEVAQRTEYFFQTCMEHGQRPTVEAYALSLGVTRTMMGYWKSGRYCSAERTEIINQAYEVFAAFDAGMVITNKMQAVPYIYRSKNYYGMRDNVQVEVGPVQEEDQKTPEQLEEYLNIVDSV